MANSKGTLEKPSGDCYSHQLPMLFRFILLLLLSIFSIYQCHATDLALVGAKIYTSPVDPPIEKGTILIHEGHILSVGPMADIKIPRGFQVLDCNGLEITAGFWNSHVHILLPGLLHAEKLSSGQITSQLQEMLTRWGFTTVFDIASVLKNTDLIRRRIKGGEVKGPRILTVGEPFWVKAPIYIKDFLDVNRINIPEDESISEARERVRHQIRDGADGIKIFANSIESNEILTMPLNLAKAIILEAHRAGKPVFAHVSNNQGLEVSIRSGVDVIAHTTPIDSLWTPVFAARLTNAHLALTPTLTLWDVESKKTTNSPDDIEKRMSRAAKQLNAFLKAGGQVLFGTDVGYIQQFNTSEEFAWMSRSGLTFNEILATLTTNPARRFGCSAHSGRIAKGFDADLVILNADPAKNISALSKVRYTIRNGVIIYAEKEGR